MVVTKLESAWAVGATDEDASLYAGIGKMSLSRYLRAKPAVALRKEQLLANPVMASLKKVVKNIDENVETAKWYLAKKRPKQYGDRITHDGQVEMTLSEKAKQQLDKIKNK